MTMILGERDPSKNIDYRSRGDSGTRQGEISWCLDQVDYNFPEGRDSYLKLRLLLGYLLRAYILFRTSLPKCLCEIDTCRHCLLLPSYQMCL